MNTPRSLQDINKDILKTMLLGIPGILMLAVGLYGFFVEEPGALHPALEQSGLVIGLLGVGVVNWFWYSRTLLRLAREKAAVLGS